MVPEVQSNYTTDFGSARPSDSSSFDDYFTGEQAGGGFEDFPSYSSGSTLEDTREPGSASSVAGGSFDDFPSYSSGDTYVPPGSDYEMRESGPASSVAVEAEATDASVARVKRCTVIGPRVCVRDEEEQWSCEQTHYRNIASSFCERESTTVQLTVGQHLSYNETFIVMAPPEQEEEGYGYEEEDADDEEGSGRSWKMGVCK